MLDLVKGINEPRASGGRLQWCGAASDVPIAFSGVIVAEHLPNAWPVDGRGPVPEFDGPSGAGPAAQLGGD